MRVAVAAGTRRVKNCPPSRDSGEGGPKLNGPLVGVAVPGVDAQRHCSLDPPLLNQGPEPYRRLAWQHGEASPRLRSRSWGMVFAMNPVVHFLPVNGHVRWGLDAKANLAVSGLNDNDHDAAADYDFL